MTEGGFVHSILLIKEGFLMKKTKINPKNICPLRTMADEEPHSDVLGSYTGTGENGERPVQDADDL